MNHIVCKDQGAAIYPSIHPAIKSVSRFKQTLDAYEELEYQYDE